MPRKTNGKANGKVGHSSIYTTKLALELCARLAVGESLVEICRSDKMPSYRTVMNWLFNDFPADDQRTEFAQLYARARQIQAETYADQMIVLADQDANDVLYDLDGHPVQATSVRINRNRLQIDTRWRIITKLLPRFAEKVTVEGGEKPLEIETNTRDIRELARQTALILYRADPKRKQLTDQRKEK